MAVLREALVHLCPRIRRKRDCARLGRGRGGVDDAAAAPKTLDPQDLIVGQFLASPRSGTQAAVLVLERMAAGATSGIHTHLEADELFYVIGGTGRILVGAEERCPTTFR